MRDLRDLHLEAEAALGFSGWSKEDLRERLMAAAARIGELEDSMTYKTKITTKTKSPAWHQPVLARLLRNLWTKEGFLLPEGILVWVTGAGTVFPYDPADVPGCNMIAVKQGAFQANAEDYYVVP